MVFTALRYLWPSVWTFLGLVIGLLSYCRGGRIVFYRGTIGCYGSRLSNWLNAMPLSGGANAMTLGHTILARNYKVFMETFDHEYVHVKQYERWGVFFVPAYLAVSCWLWSRGQHPYWDNPFEIEAYRES